MLNTLYKVFIEVTKSPNEVFNPLITLSKWWAEEFVGEELKANSTFILKIGNEHISRNQVIEFIPDKKFVWVTTESKRNTDNFDWTGTKMIFELSPISGGTQITFTYDGVVLESEQNRLKEICDYCIKNLLYNYLESFSTTIEVSTSPQEVFKILSDDVSNWWGGKDLSGKSSTLHDEFIINHPGAHYSKQQLMEVIPHQKLVWRVTESTLDWLKKNKHEWTNTKMIFELTQKNGKTTIHFTHQGLVPELECYDLVHQGWTTIITDYLFNYITSGKVAEQLFK